MAINFLDGITVNSGTGTAATIVASGARPVTITGGALGTIAIGGSNGGWATGYWFTGYSGTNRGGFGALGSVDAVSYFWIGDAYNDTTMVIQPNAGNVGIGTTAPTSKLQVIGNAHVDNNAEALHLNSADTNGPYMTFSKSNTIMGYLGSAYHLSSSPNNLATTMTLRGNTRIDFNIAATPRMTISNAGKVGIGTTNPSATLHVSSGYLKVEGVGCGIQMPDTSGNPLFAITTDQNTFAGCNIVNGWGNSSNTGVGVGTTRSDGTAFQVRTGITLSSGNATNSGTQRLVVNGDGGTKITKSLGVGANASTTTGRIDASNDIVAYSSSDIRLKDNIKSIDKALDKVNKIQGIEFDWIEKEEVHGNSGHDVGVIAQEIEKVLPEVVDTRDNGYKAVKYEKLVPLLIEAIKDLSRQVDGLKRLI